MQKINLRLQNQNNDQNTFSFIVTPIFSSHKRFQSTTGLDQSNSAAAAARTFAAHSLTPLRSPAPAFIHHLAAWNVFWTSRLWAATAERRAQLRCAIAPLRHARCCRHVRWVCSRIRCTCCAPCFRLSCRIHRDCWARRRWRWRRRRCWKRNPQSQDCRDARGHGLPRYHHPHRCSEFSRHISLLVHI